MRRECIAAGEDKGGQSRLRHVARERKCHVGASPYGVRVGARFRSLENLQTSEGIFPICGERGIAAVGKNHEEFIELRNKRRRKFTLTDL